jgi:hypothetical protein
MNKFIVLKTLIHTIVLFATRKGIDSYPIMVSKSDISHQLRVCSMIIMFTLYAAQASRVAKLELAPALLLFKKVLFLLSRRQQQSMPTGEGK